MLQMPAHSKKHIRNPLQQKCWAGYFKDGTKKKGGHTVNNCKKKS